MHDDMLSWSISLTLLMIAGASGCFTRTSPSCTHSGECDDGSLCRMGECIPSASALEANEERRASVDGGSSTLPAERTQSSNPSSSNHSEAGSSNASNRPSTSPSGSSGGSDASASTSDPCPDGRAPASEELVLNEAMINVPSGPRGDTNGDGARDAFDDEFIELVNVSESTLDLQGVTFIESGAPAFEFESGCLASREGIVVYGGYESSAPPDALGGTPVRIAPDRLGLSNGGGTLTIRNRVGTRLARLEWSDAPAESLTLTPQLRGETYQPHSAMTSGVLSTPGRCADGRAFESGCGAMASEDVGVDVGPTADAGSTDDSAL